MLKIALKSDPQKLLNKFRERGPAIAEVLRSKLSALLYVLQAKIVREKLSGQMLNRRTGVLAGSIRALPARFEGTSIIGTVEGGGGPAFYGKFFEVAEAGGTGGTRAHTILSVKARALRFVTGGKEVFAKQVAHPGFAARPFMTSSLNEMAGQIRNEMQAALDEELGK